MEQEERKLGWRTRRDPLYEELPLQPHRPGKTVPGPKALHPLHPSSWRRQQKTRTLAVSKQSQRKPRGNLPPAPTFDGDKRRDPKVFRKYLGKVDSYVAIAQNIKDGYHGML